MGGRGLLLDFDDDCHHHMIFCFFLFHFPMQGLEFYLIRLFVMKKRFGIFYPVICVAVICSFIRSKFSQLFFLSSFLICWNADNILMLKNNRLCGSLSIV